MKQHSITSFQAFTMVLMTVVGMNVLMFPRSMGEIAGRDGIWVMLILVAIVAIILYFMTLLGQWFPRDSYVEYTEKILGSNRYKWVGKGASYSVSSRFRGILVVSCRVYY